MINSINIKKTATFDISGETIGNLSKFNYFFGSNGTGKTTISRVIDNENVFSDCYISWDNGAKLNTLVYNSDFIEKNFEESKDLEGVFTLGEENVKIKNQVANIKQTIDDISKGIEGLKTTLKGEDGEGGKKKELSELDEELKEKCWAQKQKYDSKFKEAFKGYRGNSKKFMQKVLKKFESNNQDLISLDKLEKKADTIFESNPTKENLLPIYNMEKVLKYKNNSILQKVVIGKEDVDIAEMIKKLDNSDWVKDGIKYFEINEGVCPFCQQNTSEKFAESLNEYFDETYQKDIKKIIKIKNDCKSDYQELQEYLNSVISTDHKFLDIEKLKNQKKILDSKIEVNLQQINLKKQQPSRVVSLKSIENIINEIRNIIISANHKIDKHNKMVSHLKEERRKLTAQVWKYVIDQELKSDLSTYKSKRRNIKKAINAIKKKIKEKELEKDTKTDELEKLEEKKTSINPTKNGINKLLKSFGFRNFYLDITENRKSYKLVRPDGSNAKNTLSEGEKNFVTFLYFYYLLKGSKKESGITKNRIVVFDDPVSSFDSDILFIVSSLIRGIIEEVRNNTGYIKQVFVLTHNIYFHKEVTFNNNRCNRAMNEETFWIVRKISSKSKIFKHEKNPIKTTYELLWSEVKNPNRSKLTVQNTLRRILENYFKILGGIDPYTICQRFDGKDKLICKSLFSWVHDGSHSAYDNIYISQNDTAVENYLRVFKEIFHKTKHEAHYKMMIGNEGEE